MRSLVIAGLAFTGIGMRLRRILPDQHFTREVSFYGK